MWSEAERAEELVRMVRSRGVDLRVVPDPDRGEVIVPVRLSASARELEPGVVDRLKRLRPWVLAYLEGVSRPASPTSGAAVVGRPAGSKPAPPVPKAARAEVRARIGRLAIEPGPAAVDGVVGALARALGDDGPESRRLYRGLAAEVQAGTKPMDLLIGAFEWGCGRGARHRGRLFTEGVKDWLRRDGRGHPPG